MVGLPPKRIGTNPLAQCRAGETATRFCQLWTGVGYGEADRHKAGSLLTLRWREMDSNFRFRASGDTPHRPRGEAASHRSRLPLRRDPPSGRDLDDGIWRVPSAVSPV